MAPLPATVALEVIECPKCAVVFAVTRAYFDARVADRAFFWCPEACNIQLGVESTTDRLLTATLAELQSAQTQLFEQKLKSIELGREVRALRQAMVDHVVGPATAQEEG